MESDRGVDLFSRRHKSFNHQYPHIVEALGELPEGTVVDGEVVVIDDSGYNALHGPQSIRSCVVWNDCFRFLLATREYAKSP